MTDEEKKKNLERVRRFRQRLYADPKRHLEHKKKDRLRKRCRKS